MFKLPEDDNKYSWTWHIKEKMRYYKISTSLVKRIIRSPERTEKGIAPDTIASMKIAKKKRREEIWVMYRPAGGQVNSKRGGKIRIITAWRYPGESPERDPIPKHVLQEIKSLL